MKLNNRNSAVHRISTILLTGALCIGIWVTGIGTFSPDLLHAEDAVVEIAPPEVPLPVPAATKEIVKVTEGGIVPADLTMTVPDGTIFLVNFADGKPMDIAIEFGKRRVHCHSKNLELNDAGIMRTIKPVSPQDFAVLCFPEKGTYPYTVSLGEKQKFKGTVTVQ